jgi:tRNA (guanine37-N1)-methyltransferase
MRLDILTLFPEVFAPLFASIPARAQTSGRVKVELHNLRDWGRGRHRQVDDVPFGGGPGMVIQAEPLAAAIRAVQALDPKPARVVYLTPQGTPLSQAMVEELVTRPRLLLLCGHYEGIDERIRETLVEQEVSIGDYVLSGGELPAMVLADALIRLVPGVIDSESVACESFSTGILDHPHYSRPAVFEGRPVPEVLLSGHHGRIEAWRREQALLNTARRRPDLLARVELNAAERRLVGGCHERGAPSKP